jgi:hypothetical protein
MEMKLSRVNPLKDSLKQGRALFYPTSFLIGIRLVLTEDASH